MLTQFVTILIIVSVIGCILYGRRLIRTEKVDAVFGNPERAKGGTHWVIVGTSAILMLWLYYSWDIAKGFYPKSANELCQVAKINESLLGLKYQFPIEEREFKSTSIIKIENIINTNIKSEGLLKGVVQVPADGNPIIMLSDHGTIGGYPKIGVVASVDYDRLVQIAPGSKIKFKEIKLSDAETLFKLYEMETQNLISQI